MTPDIRQLLAALANRLEGASIRRSAVEEAILSASGGAGLRAHVDQLLAEAGISVVEDVAVDPSPPTVEQPESKETVDPIESARRRLELDRGRPPGRLAKILLKAEEEVGLTLLARPDGVQLEAGGVRAPDG